MNHSRFFVFLLFLLVLNLSVHAVGVTPSRLYAPNMARGSSISLTFQLSGVSKGESITVIPKGEIKEWIDWDRDLVFQGDGSMKISLVVTVPPNAANGIYNGSAVVRAAPNQDSKGKGSSVGILTGVKMQIFVDVTGEQVYDYKILYADIPKSEEGDELPLVMEVENKGNVQAKPSNVVIKVYDKFKKEILYESDETVKEGVPPHESGKIHVLFDHEIPAGEYWAQIDVFDKGEKIFSDSMFFEILEAGFGKREGILGSILVDHKIILGEPVKVTGVFRNTGELQVSAQMILEIMKDDRLVAVSRSSEVTVDPGEEGLLVGYYTPEEIGKYIISGYVSYTNKQTGNRESFFLVTGNAVKTEGMGLSGGTLVIIALGVLFVIVIFIFSKRREA